MLKGLLDGVSETFVNLDDYSTLTYAPQRSGQASWAVTRNQLTPRFFYNADLPVLARDGHISRRHVYFRLTPTEQASLSVWLDQQLENGNWRVQPYNESEALQESELRQRHWEAAVRNRFPPGSKVWVEPGYVDDEGEVLDDAEFFVVAGYDLDYGKGSWPYVIIENPQTKRRYLVDDEILHIVPR